MTDEPDLRPSLTDVTSLDYSALSEGGLSAAIGELVSQAHEGDETA